jgi:transcriptional regulator with XRE-family HTH domain
MIGQEIRKLRESMHLDQTQFAKLFKVKTALVQRWESGEEDPSSRLQDLMSRIEMNAEMDAMEKIAEDETRGAEFLGKLLGGGVQRSFGRITNTVVATVVVLIILKALHIIPEKIMMRLFLGFFALVLLFVEVVSIAGILGSREKWSWRYWLTPGRDPFYVKIAMLMVPIGIGYVIYLLIINM